MRLPDRSRFVLSSSRAHARARPWRVLIPVLAVAVACTAAAPALGARRPGSARPAAAARARTWLQEINYYRLSTGLKPVANDRAWDRGILNHLKYLEYTPAKYLTGQYASVHTENPKSPYYTASGALEGSRSDLIIGGAGSPLDAIDSWLAAPFHAIGMLRSPLRKVAFAEGYIGAGLDVLGGLTGPPQGSKPVLFPGPMSTTNLVSFSSGELPDPAQSCHWAKSVAHDPIGLPIIALLSHTPSRHLVAKLKLPSGKVERTTARTLCLVDQFTYHSTDKIYGPTGLEILEGANAVLLLPSGTLANGWYTVTITDTAKITYGWRFRVRA
jgi:hypothetical protein